MDLKTTFKALNDETRRKILDLLKSQRLNALEIAKNFTMTEATVSHHLSILKNADLVRTERIGKNVFYELNTSIFDDILIWINTFKEVKK